MNTAPVAAGPASVGFSRATGSKGSAKGGFDALLAAVSALIEQATGIDVSGGASGQQDAGAAFTKAATAANDQALSALAGEGQQATATNAPGAAAEAGASPASSPDKTQKTVLGTLGQTLAAIEQTLAQGKKPDKASLDKLDGALNALAGILNLPQAQASVAAAAPAAGSAAAGSGATAIGATGSTGFTLDAQSVLDLLAGRSGALPPKLAEFADKDSATLAGLEVKVAPKSVLAGLSGKLTDLATELHDAAPDVAAKLADLGNTLGSADPSPDTLAKLGFAADTSTPDQQVAAALTAPTSNASGKDAAPPPFAAPQLSLPADSALSGKPGAAGKPAGPSSTQGQSATTAAGPAAAVASSSGAGGNTHTGAGDADKSKDQSQGATKPKADAASSANPSKDAATPLGAATDASGQSGVQQAANTSAPASAVPTQFRPVQAAYQSPQSPINLQQFAFQFMHQASQGSNHFQLRLDPPDLGRVDVRLHVDPAGAVTAHMTVERTDTLDLMQRDRPQLERALAQAGLDSGKTDLQFSLNQNPSFQQNGGGNQRPSFNFAQAGTPVPDTSETPSLPQPALYRGVLTQGGINLFA